MGRTMEWFESRVPRAEKVIREAREQSRLDVVALLSAMGAITTRSPGEGEARLLSQALGVLRADEFCYLVRQVARALEQQSSNEARRAGELAEQRWQELRKAGQETGSGIPEAAPSIADVHTEAGDERSAVLVLAVILQALIWTVGLGDGFFDFTY